MTLSNNYEMQTTFVQDFAIADKFGLDAIRETFDRAFGEWKSNYVYLTELVITLNLAIWHYYSNNDAYARLYNELWQIADNYALEHLKGNELNYFLRTTD